MTRRAQSNESLRPPDDPAILALIRALARQAAREDHAAAKATEKHG